MVPTAYKCFRRCSINLNPHAQRREPRKFKVRHSNCRKLPASGTPLKSKQETRESKPRTTTTLRQSQSRAFNTVKMAGAAPALIAVLAVLVWLHSHGLAVCVGEAIRAPRKASVGVGPLASARHNLHPKEMCVRQVHCTCKTFCNTLAQANWYTQK